MKGISTVMVAATLVFVAAPFAWAQRAATEGAEEAAPVSPPPVGGLFGLFGGGAEPTATPAAAPRRRLRATPVERAATPRPEPTATERAEPTATERPEQTATERPEPTATEGPRPTRTEAAEATRTPRPVPTPAGAAAPAARRTATPEPTPTEEPLEERPIEDVEPTAVPPTPLPTEEPRVPQGLEAELPPPLGGIAPEPATPPTERATPPTERGDAAPADEPRRGGTERHGPDGTSVELPPEEIQGDIDRPEIFFLLPRARDRSDEQTIRARIRREVTRPLIKDWLEEEMLIK